MFFDEWNTALLWGLIIALNGNNKIDPRTKVINTVVISTTYLHRTMR